jgi:hypothetical protein
MKKFLATLLLGVLIGSGACMSYYYCTADKVFVRDGNSYVLAHAIYLVDGDPFNSAVLTHGAAQRIRDLAYISSMDRAAMDRETRSDFIRAIRPLEDWARHSCGKEKEVALEVLAGLTVVEADLDRDMYINKEVKELREEK